jgi:Uma2 family endonuclease
MSVLEAPELMQRHKITVDEYYRMAEAGVLAPDARVELIEGEIVDMAPMKSRHAGVIARLNVMTNRAVGDRAVVTCQTPLRLGDRSEPESDLMLLRPRPDFYTRSHPTAADVLLLIEVSDTTLAYDRGVKLPLYAKHGVTEVWIVDLENNLVRFFRQPAGENYTDITASETPGDTPVAALPGVTIDLSRVFS